MGLKYLQPEMIMVRHCSLYFLNKIIPDNFF